MRSSGPLWALDGIAPTIAADAWIARTATVIGDVHVGSLSSIWWHCVVRGDVNHIRIGARTNIQDGTIVHVNGELYPTLIGNDVTIGHACIIHACTLEDHAFVGMGATVLDGAVIEAGGMLAAGGLLTPRKRIGPNELWAGSPAKLLRVMDAAERAGWDRNAANYVENGRRYRAGLTAV